MTENDEGAYDTRLLGLTGDAREAVDNLRAENSDLAVENERLREVGRKYAEQTRETLAERNDAADRFLRRIERLRRAVAAGRAEVAELVSALHDTLDHIDADHASMDRAAQSLARHECAVRVLARQRDDLLTATRTLTEHVATLTHERDEARRDKDALAESGHEMRRAWKAHVCAPDQHERLTGGE